MTLIRFKYLRRDGSCPHRTDNLLNAEQSASIATLAFAGMVVTFFFSLVTSASLASAMFGSFAAIAGGAAVRCVQTVNTVLRHDSRARLVGCPGCRASQLPSTQRHELARLG